MKKKIIKIRNILGDKLITYHQGDIIYQIVNKEIKRRIVVLDFEGITFSSGAFFNATIGKLVCEYGVEKIKNSLLLINISDSDRFILKRVITIAKRTAEEE